ncbi:DNA (cytosine-5-)-methyltransferase [Spiroplasma platyhelix]|uniref:Cytosine-specific methyltransferase n=1 Tax=Spiroplasma platyhelix PALS-1 TaxID=1276218 RepID=A0A846U274_9MOLU|nr:DNA (cytosine-5-)-methyltransferase [Spiroplasma platyhelix]MBE4704246.1 hypothetical protein [Spiroplasma platyhelix PALS-1]NKE38619.1 DNA (cytosine-5-)-methyltransferase [Spiroplasma platyhelix PALS-1]UJB28830.1 DNA (cytosine-5)-methyltransferase 1 [Spiroplasma platyhelix PALS-1]
MKKIKVVELFAGVGGFRLGLENSSKKIFHTVWANQWEPKKQKQHAFNCYNHNFGNSKNHSNQDIAVAKFEMPNNIDLLVGGFPCQDYSVARTQAAGIQGEKGVLWWEISWIIKEKKPKMILLENVNRLLKSTKTHKGRDFGIILRDLYNNGYYVEWRVINAAEYGLQQKRRRIFIFAYKKDINFFNIKNANFDNALDLIQKNGFFAKSFKIIKEITLDNIKEIDIKEKFIDLADVSDNFKFDFENSGCMIDSKIFTTNATPYSNQPKNLENIILNTEVEEKYFLTKTQELKLSLLKDRKRIQRTKPNGDIYYYSEGKMSFPDRIDSPARTMLTSEGTINRSSHIIEDPKTKKLRFLTPIETERINGFPDNWTNTDMPERFRYFCMGNALVVDLIKIMGDTIQEIWNQKYNQAKANKKISIVETMLIN